MKDKLFIELVIVLVLVGFGLWSLKNSVPSVSPDTEEITSTEDTSEGSVNVSTPAASLSYAQALARYKDARIQLNQDCRSTPTSATYKNNTSIMIDNRSAVNRTVKIDSVFSIKAWGFKIVKLSSSTLPATWYMDCDTSQNVATLLIQN